MSNIDTERITDDVGPPLPHAIVDNRPSVAYGDGLTELTRKVVRYLVISDIHLGHRKTKTAFIINNIDRFFKDNHSLLKTLDILFIAGDVYDDLLTAGSSEFILANQALARIAKYCGKYDIILRVLRGTPSHDWDQLAVFSTTVDELDIDINYRYINELSIEFIESLGLHVLYVPDEWSESAADTEIEVSKLLELHKLTRVDIAIMHGQFAYQLPMIELESSHSEEYYLSIVKYYINIGHIHISSAHGRILAQGSFDRIAHREEGSKGAMVMSIYHSGEMEFLFIKNKHAYPYKRYDLTKYTTEDMMRYLNRVLPKLKLGTRVMLVVDGNVTNKLLAPVQDKFKDMSFTVVKKKDKIAAVVKKNKVVIEPFEITKENIDGLLMTALEESGASLVDMTLAKEELSDIM